MTTRSELRQTFYENMLSDSPSSVRYWALTEWDEKPGEPEFSRLVVKEFGDEDVNGPALSRHEVTVDDMARGWQLLVKHEADGKFHHCGSSDSVRTAEKSINADAADYDACVIDAVIQLAILGEVRYG
ncbi:hypothetical protein NONI108955_20985 [Nocardia ninae]|uniref:Uncharacterized protein n=1 Tax=Nocardia ninae NBRC 108245 TaxID=1210091 RepID=A0A511MA09_9NOCA|nr:hypothetical protein [Nocardia ninae]GEM37429.1 hypothetical protein NN4_19480 [Nocardia ninae NBRC 108245]